MTYTESPIPGLWIILPEIYSDSRGYFMEAYKQSEFDKHIGLTRFLQDNQSRSSFGVLRGLHFQSGDAAQAKLVRVIEGRVWDVAVDIRKDSPTFGRYYAVEISADNQIQFFIPRGFAHGFLVLSETATFLYKVDNTYSPETEQTINCMDPDLNIQWPMNPAQCLLSEKDKVGTNLKNILL